MDSRRPWRGACRTAVVVGGLFGCFISQHATHAQTQHREIPATATASRLLELRSPHFLIHTDLTLDETHRLVVQLERMLDLISTYWGRPMRGAIECYVVRDIDSFPLVDVMDPIGIQAIRTVGGMNVTRTVSDGQRYLAKSIVYADQRPKVVLHEVVHAYCHHSFGRTGPIWYSEGMAEMGHYWIDGDPTVHADLREISYLRQNSTRTLAESMSPHQITGDSWQNYASRWGLCHFMTHAPNYSSEFSQLGREILMGRDVTFRRTYGNVANELSFEYKFFLKHIAQGYCVRRTGWDWNKRFSALRTGRTVITAVSAGRGWQPTGVTVKSGVQYQYASTGKCSIAKGIPHVGADGDGLGRGRLVGILMDDYELGTEFELGSGGSFHATGDGNLYLRCRNAWGELAADTGQLSVKLQFPRKSQRK